MVLGIPPLRIKILRESNPRRSTMLAGGLAVASTFRAFEVLDGASATASSFRSTGMILIIFRSLLLSLLLLLQASFARPWNITYVPWLLLAVFLHGFSKCVVFFISCVFTWNYMYVLAVFLPGFKNVCELCGAHFY